MVTRILQDSRISGFKFRVYFGPDNGLFSQLAPVPGLTSYPTAQAALEAFKTEYHAPQATVDKITGLVLTNFHAPVTKLIFDYEHQCWVRDGIVEDCGHLQGRECGCYGRAHKGEKSDAIEKAA